ncbi:MAG: hypothetical protein KUG79_06695 [Pseudomonadales bacterium]|nr:hypothetical protein [Pseudomonadales bacterium]
MKIYMPLILSILLLLFSSPAVRAGEFAVSPMMIELNMSPGDTADISFQVHGKMAGVAAISISQMRQQASGHMAFLPPDDEAQGVDRWVSLERTLLPVKQGETQTVRGTLTLPKKLQGNHVLAIMIEDQKTKNKRGVNLNVRYAIVITVNTPIKNRRLKSDFSDLTIEEQNGNYFVTGWFENKSDRDSYFESVISLRNDKRRLVARVPLLTKSAWQRQDVNSRVFPQGRVKVFGLIPEKVVNGEYTLSSRSRFGGRMMPSVKMTTLLSRANVLDLTEKGRSVVSVVPNPVLVETSKRGHSFSSLRIDNPLSELITVNLPAEQSGQGWSYRFSPNTVTIKPRSTRMVTLKQSFSNAPKGHVFHAEVIRANSDIQKLEIKTKI